MFRQPSRVFFVCCLVLLTQSYGLSATVLTAVGTSGTIIRSTDGGQSWAPQPVSTDRDLRTVDFFDLNDGFAAGFYESINTTLSYATIQQTQTGGASWQFAGFVAPSNNRLAINDLHYFDRDVGWFAAGNGNIWKTVDGGSLWSRQVSNEPWGFRAIDFVDENHGWAVGENGVIISTQDGGDIWDTIRKTGVSDTLLGVDFVDPSTGWAVGSLGEILHTTDGGSNWASQSYPFVNNASLRDVQFLNSSEGWIVGSGGTILHTDDGGVNWLEQLSGTGALLNAVEFLDENLGWAVGEGGTILHTDNGGNTWQLQVSGTVQTLNDIVAIVPEPTTCTLALAALCFVMGRRQVR